MTLIRSWRQQILHVLLVALCIHGATSFRLLPKQIGMRLRTITDEDVDRSVHATYGIDQDLGITFNKPTSPDNLQALISPELADTTGVYQHALELLSAAQASPSCYRIATSDLLESCHSIDGSTRKTEHNTEYLKSIYAARLASCEIEDAGSPLPQQCQSLSMSKANQHTGHLTKQLNDCLQALESRPQWWTSYSNSKQNAVALCKAVRADIDRDDMIKLHKQMVETQADTHGLLAKTTKATYYELATLQTEFEQVRRIFQERLEEDIAAASKKAGTYLERLAHGIGTLLDGLHSKVIIANDAIEAQSASILANVDRANAAAHDLDNHISKVFGKVVEGSSQLAHIQTAQWETSQGVANDLLASMRSMQNDHVNALVQTIRGVGMHLDNSNQLVARIHDRQNNIEERMTHLTSSFASLESSAARLTATQNAQAEKQSQLHGQLEIDMQITKGHLTDVMRSALGLQQIVTDTAASVPMLAGFTKIFRSAADWVVSLLVILALVAAALVIRMVLRFTHWGGFALLVLTVLILAKDYTPLFERLATLSPSISATLDIALADTFLLSSVAFGLALCIALISYAFKKRPKDSAWTFAPLLAPFLAFSSRHSKKRSECAKKDLDTLSTDH